MKVAFLFTTHNRIEKTKACIDSLKRAVAYADERTAGLNLRDAWYVTDAGSSDGTVDMIRESVGGNDGAADSVRRSVSLSKLHICEENSDIFYSQGMRKCMEMVLAAGLSDESENESKNVCCAKDEIDYVFLINDDVLFYEDFLYRMLEKAGAECGNNTQKYKVLVGATDHNGVQTYGGVRYDKGIAGSKLGRMIPRAISFKRVDISEDNLKCDTFNANCVMIPYKVMKNIGPMDAEFIHGLGDFDYGMMISEIGNVIESTDFYVGDCGNNAREGTWMDTGLSRHDRIRRLNSIKGAPTKQWFYYLRKHFGLSTALLHSISPYIRIMIGK